MKDLSLFNQGIKASFFHLKIEIENTNFISKPAELYEVK